MACVHFQNALKLRKLEKYHEAGEELKLTNDPEGRVHLGYAYLYGGFGISEDQKKGVEILEICCHPWANVLLKIFDYRKYILEPNECDPFTMSVYDYYLVGDRYDSVDNALSALEKGNPFIVLFMTRVLYLGPSEYMEHLEKYLDAGDAHAQFMIGYNNPHNEKYPWLKKACDQKLQIAYHHLAMYLKMSNNPNYALEATRMFILAKNPQRVVCDNVEIEFQSFYLYGQYYVISGNNSNADLKVRSIEVYQETTTKCRFTVLYWMWISKRFMCKDLARMIGKMVYDSRYIPMIWREE